MMSSFSYWSLRINLLLSVVLIQACEAQPESSELVAISQALTVEEKRILAFEVASDWHDWSSTAGITFENSPNASEGASSLAISGLGYAGVRNVNPITKDEHPAPAVVGYDVRVPENQVNPWWHGDTQLYIDAPSAGVWGQYLGYRSFNDLSKGEFVRVEFPLPD